MDREYGERLRERWEECSKELKDKLDEMERKIGHSYTSGEGEEEEERSVYNKGGNIYSRTESACSGR